MIEINFKQSGTVIIDPDDVRLTRKCAAHLVGVAGETIRRFVKDGKLIERDWENGHGTYYTLSDVMELIANRQMQTVADEK